MLQPRPARLQTIHWIAALTLLTPCCQTTDDPAGVLADAPRLELSEEPAVDAELQVALDGLLEDLADGSLDGRWVDPVDREQNDFYYASVLRGAKDTVPGAMKSYTLDGSTYMMTIAFARPNGTMSRIVEVEAVPRDGSYRFRSPFASRAARLNQQTIGAVTFHFSGTLSRERAEEFVRFREGFAADAGIPSGPLDYYCFHSLDELLKTYGLVHDASKCNFLGRDLGFVADGGRRYVTGTGDARYLFGFVRGTLGDAVDDPDSAYGPYANGIAAYYGGYSLSGDSMETLAQQFRDELARRPDLDFLEEFRKGRKSSVQRHFSYYVMCAFLYGEIASQHGTRRALDVLESGAGGERFFAQVEALLGVNEAGFHDLIVDLIQPATRRTGS